MLWKKTNGESINEPIIKTVEESIKLEIKNGYQLKVCIGTDSLVKKGITEFATVIVILRIKYGGFMFVSNSIMNQSLTLKERMLLEVSRSVEIAYELGPIFNKYKVEMEVHADINPNPQFKSFEALKDSMGYIMGMGYTFKAKPDAFASSSCADKMVH